MDLVALFHITFIESVKVLFLLYFGLIWMHFIVILPNIITCHSTKRHNNTFLLFVSKMALSFRNNKNVHILDKYTSKSRTKLNVGHFPIKLITEL